MSPDELERLVAAWLDGRLTAEESAVLQDELRISADARAAFSQWTRLDAALRETADEAVLGTASSAPLPAGSTPPGTLSESRRMSGMATPAHRNTLDRGLLRPIWIAASLCFVIAAAIYIQFSRSEPSIVRVTGLSGSLLWTGNGGQIVSGLDVGVPLPGGTIEGLAPDSWCELTFADGTTCTVSGESLLTYSDFGQKELRLKEGRFLADVAPQPAGKPMLVHTRSTLLKVVGTKFEVQSDLSTTSLQVQEGKVQLRRLSDNQTVDVAARHRLISTPEGNLEPQPVPEPVHDWTSLLRYGPEDMYGDWKAATSETPARLEAIPFVPKENQEVRLHLLGLPVWREDRSPVVLAPGSRFIVRGRLETPADVYFGIRMARDNGEFGGMFLARKEAAHIGNDPDFEISFSLDEFGLDPCVWHKKDELPSRPENLELKGVWSFTAIGRPTGLEVTEVELKPAFTDIASR